MISGKYEVIQIGGAVLYHQKRQNFPFFLSKTEFFAVTI